MEQFGFFFRSPIAFETGKHNGKYSVYMAWLAWHVQSYLDNFEKGYPGSGS